MTPDRHLNFLQIEILCKYEHTTPLPETCSNSRELRFGEEQAHQACSFQNRTRTAMSLLHLFSRNKHRHHSFESWPRGFLGGPFDVSFGTSSNKPFRPENEHIDSLPSLMCEVKSFLTETLSSLESSCAVDSSDSVQWCCRNRHQLQLVTVLSFQVLSLKNWFFGELTQPQRMCATVLLFCFWFFLVRFFERDKYKKALPPGGSRAVKSL